MTGRVPNVPNRTQAIPIAEVNPVNQAPNRPLNAGNEPPLAAVIEAAAQPARNPRSSGGQRRPNRLQNMVAKHAQLQNDAKSAARALQLERVQARGLAPTEKATRLIEPVTNFISALDALDSASPSKRQAIASDSEFSEFFVLRFRCRAAIQKQDGTMSRWFDVQAQAYSTSLDPFHLNATATERKALHRLGREACRSALENLSDIRRALELDPSKSSQLRIESRKYSELANLTKMALTLMSTKRLEHHAANLESLTGEAAGQLFRQSLLLTSALFPFLTDSTELFSDDWAQQMHTIAADIACVCLDLAACAMGILLPEPDASHNAEEIDQARVILDETVCSCLDLADQMKYWQEDNLPSDQISTSQGRKAGSFVSVLAPTGLHVPAQIQDDGTARTLGAGAEVFGRKSSTDVEFHLIEEEDTDSDSDVAVDAPAHRPDSRATKTLQKSADLLALDVEKEFRSVTSGKGISNPDLLTPSYRHYAEKWQKRAKDMLNMAAKLETLPLHASNVSDEQKSASIELAANLREQANNLQSKAQELARPETRWSLIKAYARPQAGHWDELLKNDQIRQVGQVFELHSKQSGTLFEVCIHSQPDADGATYPPVWLHLHAKQTVQLQHVKKASFESFAAVHLKSNIDRNRGPQWVEAQKAMGNHNIDVHRSPVNADLLKALMKRSGKKATPIPQTSPSGAHR